MDNAEFRNSFLFAQHTLHQYRHNAILPGAPSYYLGYLHEGYGRLQSREVTLTVGPGDLFYIPKGCAYHSYWHNEGNIRFDSLGFQHFPFPEDTAYPLQVVPVTDSLRAKLDRLSAHKEIDGLSVGLLYQILQEALPTMVSTAKPNRNRLAEEAVARMQRHPEVTVAEIARRCGVSESTLYGCFRQVYRKTPVAMRQEIAVQQAVGLLTTTDLPVETISEQLGFCSPAYFRKVFKAHTGLSPREMRKGRPF